MLSKKYRLVKNKDFENIFKNSRAQNSAFLSVRFIKNNLKFSRFGFLVGSRVSKKATLRNKIKRQLREVVRKILEEIKKGFDIVIIAQPQIAQTKQKKEIIIKNLLKKAKLLN